MLSDPKLHITKIKITTHRKYSSRPLGCVGVPTLAAPQIINIHATSIHMNITANIINDALKFDRVISYVLNSSTVSTKKSFSSL